MKPKISFELFRWFYFFVLWIVIMGTGMIIVEYAVGPIMQWVFNSHPYEFPTWNRIGRLVLFVLFMGFFAGTLSWFAEKKNSGR